MPLVRQANGDNSVFRSFRARHQSIRELSQGVCLIGHGKVLSIQDRDKLGNSAAPDYRPDGWVRPGHLPGAEGPRRQQDRGASVAYGAARIVAVVLPSPVAWLCDAHRVFTAAQNCSVTALVSSATFQPFVSAFSSAMAPPPACGRDPSQPSWPLPASIRQSLASASRSTP